MLETDAVDFQETSLLMPFISYVMIFSFSCLLISFVVIYFQFSSFSYRIRHSHVALRYHSLTLWFRQYTIFQLTNYGVVLIDHFLFSQYFHAKILSFDEMVVGALKASRVAFA
jgi:hypothetical protein